MRDLDVRQAVRRHLMLLHKGQCDTRIVEEMGIWSGTVRVDIAVINGELSGFELKSDRDTLQRLPLQAEIYSRIFDQMTLVAGKRHLERAIALIPSWWGVMQATDEEGTIRLEPVRSCIRNPSPDPHLLVELLWKDEVISILEAFGLANGWRSKRVKLLHNRLATELPFHVLSEHVRSALKLRQNWLGQHEVN